jgi:hypothetical protein
VIHVNGPKVGRKATTPRRARHYRRPAATALAVAVAVALAGGTATASGPKTFLGGLHTLRTVAATVPGDGDVNPYGTVTVPASQGRLVAGSVLVSNFNDRANAQGTGTTIVEISRHGTVRTFARITSRSRAGRACGGVGLTTALSVLAGGWVVVGSLPAANGTAATATAGCLFILDSQGQVVRTLAGGLINGPWDMTAVDLRQEAVLFVTNVLNGTVAAGGRVVKRGTVVRVDLSLLGHHVPRVESETVVGSGFAERSDPAALVVGPTGVALAGNGTLYVADTAGNRITAIPRAVSRRSTALTGRQVTAGGALAAPLGLTLAPGGDILTVNGGNGDAVETTPAGFQVATRALDRSGTPPGAGALFGLSVTPGGAGLYFVDDATNTLDRLS